VNRVGRRVLAALGLLVASAALSGCTVPDGSAVAIGVTDTGSPIGYALVCRGTLDSATLWDSRTGDVAGTWSIDSQGPGVLTSFALDAPAGGWTAEDPAFTGLAPGRNYQFRTYGGQGDGDGDPWASTYVTFTTHTLDTLKPGQVRYWAGTTEAGDDVFATGSVAEFQQKGCTPVAE
jgi:hypothetical protein